MNGTIPCPECGSEESNLNWIEGGAAVPEYRRGYCFECNHDWNECTREEKEDAA